MISDLINEIPFEYRIELWQSMMSVSALRNKYRFSARSRKDRYLLKVGNVYIAGGHIEEGEFVIDEMFSKEESISLSQRRDAYISERES